MKQLWPAMAFVLFSMDGIAADPVEQAIHGEPLALIEARVAACKAAIQPIMEQYRQAIEANDRAGAARAVQTAMLTCVSIAAAPIR